MSNGIQVGDAVQLSSGGPVMTVTNIEEGGLAECTWFTKNQVTNSQKFPLAALAHYSGMVFAAVSGSGRRY